MWLAQVIDDDPTLMDGLKLPAVTGESLLLGAVALVIAVVLGLALERLIRLWLAWRGRGPSAVAVFSRLGFWFVVILGTGAALTIIFPSVKPVNILGGLGVISLAAGIAFQTVLGNMFAGIVILARDKLHVGDQIHVRDVRGTVTAIDLHITTVRSFEGRKVMIPNQVMHSELVTVQTGFERVRTTVCLELEATVDTSLVRRVSLDAMRSLPEVMDEPAPEALLATFGYGALGMDLRFWSGARQLETREAQHAVIAAVVAALAEHGVSLAANRQVVEAGESLATVLRPTP